MSNGSELAIALGPVIQEFDRLKIRYYVGGSVASSQHGAARSTLDTDIAAELTEHQALELISNLKQDYYLSEAAIRDAVRRRSCFNLIHLKTSMKIDIFVSPQRKFDLSVQERATPDLIGEVNPLLARLASVEDIILLKLEWFRLGGEISERQWRDSALVAKLHEQRLDRPYLVHWAAELKVTDLLERLLGEI